MERREFLLRWALFLGSVLLVATGIAVITSAVLGTTPISSPVYAVTAHTPLSFGTGTMLFNLLLLLLSLTMMSRKEIHKERFNILWQLPVLLLFASTIDAVMYLLHHLTGVPEAWLPRMLMVIAGSLILALGVALEVIAEVALVTGEFFVRAISRRFAVNFGQVKLGFDLTLVLLALGLSWLLSGNAFESVREGTVVSALLVGPVVKALLPRLRIIDTRLRRGRRTVPPAAPAARGHGIITIAREYGCGGRLVGRALAERLHLPFYDTSLIADLVQASGLSPEFVRTHAEELPSSVLRDMFLREANNTPAQALTPEDALFVATARVIRDLAARGPLVIVGYCAGYILRDEPDLLRIYLHADEACKIALCREHYGEDEATARQNMARTDRRRNDFALRYTRSPMNAPELYDVSLDIGKFGLPLTVSLLADLYTARPAQAAPAREP